MITFHVGLHKTGTTYLQKEIFPQFTGCFVGAGGRGRYADVLRHLAGAPDDEYRPGSVRALLDDLAAHGNVLLSRESLSGTLWDEPVRTGVRTARRLAELPYDLRVVFGVRRQDSMLRSVYAQYVRQGGVEPPERFVDDGSEGFTFETEYLEYDRLFDLYMEAFGPDRVLVVPHERLLEDPEEVAGTIAAFAGASFSGTCPQRRRNPSLTGPRLETLRRWNARFRRSRFNPRPPIPLPGARAWRYPLLLMEVVRRRPSRGTPWLELVPPERIDAYRRGNRRIQDLAGMNLEALGYEV